MIESQIKEIGDRMRRLETRLTKFMETQGFETKSRRPVFEPGESIGTVSIPSMGCSVKDILASISEDWDQGLEVQVMHEGQFVMSIYLSEPETD